MQGLEENLTENSRQVCGNNSTDSIVSFVEPKYRKGSFNSKYSSPESKASAFVIENMKVIDRTIDAVSYPFTEHKSEMHRNTLLMSGLHAISGVYDLLNSDNKIPAIMSPVMFVVNANTNFFSSQQNIGVKCTIEGAYALMRGFPSIPSLFSPSAELVGAAINFSLCMNAELNTSESKIFIDKSLKFFKALLQAKNPFALSLAELKNPIGIINNMAEGNFFEGIGLKDPTSLVKTIAYTKAYWNLYDFTQSALDYLSEPSNTNKLEMSGTDTHADEL